MRDDALKNRDYTTTLMFVNEYFKHGPGYDMSESILPGVQDQDPTHWSALVGNWVTICSSLDFMVQFPKVQSSRLIPSISVVYAPGGYSDKDPQELAFTVKRGLPDLAEWKVSDDMQYCKSPRPEYLVNPKYTVSISIDGILS